MVAVVDRTADVAEAAIVTGTSRVAFNGRSVYAPDIVLVNEFVADDFLVHLVQAITTPAFKQNPIKTTKVQPSNKDSIKELEASGGVKVVVSGANGSIIEITDRQVLTYLT